jgi:type IV pilus assembly protein PilN
MKISINLASKPFVELRPLFAQLKLAMGGLALLAVLLSVGVHFYGIQAEKANAAMTALKAQTLAVQETTAANERRMRLPENQGVLARSQFLNRLFAEKAFSWTGVMMDLERVVPQGVQVTSIDPEISKQGVVTIHLRVTGDRDKAVQLVRNLEVSKHFIDPRLGSEQALTSEKAKAIGAQGANFQNVSADAAGTGVEFEILSGYQGLGKRDEGRAKRNSGVGAAAAGGGAR